MYNKNFVISLYSLINKDMENLVNKRIEVISMVDDPNPIQSGTQGTIYHVGNNVINVNWDNGRNLGLIEGVDEYKILN